SVREINCSGAKDSGESDHREVNPGPPIVTLRVDPSRGFVRRIDEDQRPELDIIVVPDRIVVDDPADPQRGAPPGQLRAPIRREPLYATRSRNPSSRLRPL
ncbi:MAG TPA: hypothetical protein VF495_08675, partial [Phenylobacterium sp.]